MVGQVYLGRYETIRLLGQGGMGRVFLARHLELDEPVVVKVMHDHIAADPVFRERFGREMEMMSRFKHPHAVLFYDASLDDPQGPCIVMEFLAGVGLDKLLAKNGRFTPARLRRYVAQLCDVLQAAHDAGVVHRDLKPANLMILDPDTPHEKLKVMDFGLAQMAEQKTGGPTEYAVGTPGYMPPEQVRGEEVDHRGDLYSVGAIIYQLLSGKMPFPGATPMEVLLAQATDGPITFASIGLGDAIPPAVEEVIRKALSLEPGDRQQSAREFHEDYEAALVSAYQSKPEPAEEDAPAAPPPTAPTVAGRTAVAASASGPRAALPTADAVDLNATVEHLEAYMPEQIATYKLKGFVEEVGGKIVQSVPGMVKVQLKVNSKALKGAGKSSLFSWLGLGPKYGLIDLELHMRKQEDAKKQSVLQITVVMRPANGSPAPTNNPEWDSRCALLCQVLKGYLMSSG
ncbi:MAG: serine/threonine protein kinase [Planctomycetia bacterium]|nr:serine/threonine protein kinase [Planctomycetia bacterium]